jgi:hypothetical protein
VYSYTIMRFSDMYWNIVNKKAHTVKRLAQEYR